MISSNLGEINLGEWNLGDHEDEAAPGELAGRCAGAATVTAALQVSRLLAGVITGAATVTGMLGGAVPVFSMHYARQRRMSF